MKGWLEKYQDGGETRKQWLQRDINESPQTKAVRQNSQDPNFAERQQDEVWNMINTVGSLTPAWPLFAANQAGREIDRGNYGSAALEAGMIAAPFAIGKGIEAITPYVKKGMSQNQQLSSIRINIPEIPTGYSTNTSSALRRELIQPVNLGEANQRLRTEMLRKSETDPYIKKYLDQHSILGFGRERAKKKIVNLPNSKVVRNAEELSEDPAYATIAHTDYGKDIHINSKLINTYDDPLTVEKEVLSHELFHNIHPSTIKNVYENVKERIPTNNFLREREISPEVIKQLSLPQEILARISEVKNKFGFKVRSDGSIRDNAGYKELTPHHFDFMRNNRDLFDVTESGVPATMRSIDLSRVNINKYATGLSGAAALAADEFKNGGQVNYNDSQVSLPPNFNGIGNLTKGRNYSSAWGGQFADGGQLTKLDQLTNFSNYGKREKGGWLDKY